MSGFEIVLVGPPLALLVMAAGACTWLASRRIAVGCGRQIAERVGARWGRHLIAASVS